MACPICGANCKCRKRGVGGVCCSCHRHKPRPIRADFVIGAVDPADVDTLRSYERHLANRPKESEADHAATAIR